MKSILNHDPEANIIVAGDFNEFTQTRSVYAPFVDLLIELDEVVNIPAVERYTFLYGQNSQQLDHVFVSSGIAKSSATAFEHIHVNSWSPSYSARVSDHDPSVGSVFICRQI